MSNEKIGASLNNANRPVMRIKLHENEALRAVVAAAKVRLFLAKSRG